MHKLYKKGFTLIELMVVIAIIGILTGIILVSLDSARAKSRDGKRISDISQIGLALELYFEQNKHYPATTVVFDNTCSPTPTETCFVGVFIPSLLKDPKGDLYKYATFIRSGGTTISNFHLGAKLEQVNPGKYDANVDWDSSVADAKGAWSSGFNGKWTNCTGLDVSSSNCYDVKGQ